MQRATRIPQTVLVIGGTSEIGTALIDAWIDLGTEEVILTGRNEGALELRASQLAQKALVRTIEMDVRAPDAVAAAMDAAWERADIDVVVIAVGTLGDQSSMEATPSRSRDVLDVNTTGTIHVALEAANRLEDQGHGTLLLLSSVAGQRGRRDNYVYGASKAALDTFAEGLAQRLQSGDTHVMIARPGYVHSRMSAGVPPAPFAVTVEESAAYIVEGYSRGRDVVWIPPVLRYVFAGLTHLPRRAWTTVVQRARPPTE